MTLEDFFTLTEMKDGLMAIARVEELVSVMKKEKDTVVTNIGEAARQWCTVASTLAATENKDSLDHFIRLDGLHFLDRWLREAHKCSGEANDSSLEEPIIALLGALEKLPIDNERSVSSGISTTIKSLFDVKSFTIQQKARTLFDCWTQRSNKDLDQQVENTGCQDNGINAVDALVVAEESECPPSVAEGSPTKVSADLANHVQKPVCGDEQSRMSDGSQLERDKDIKNSIINEQDTCQTTFSRTANEDGLTGDSRDLSALTKPCQENLTSSIGILSSSPPTESDVEGRALDVPELKALSKDDGKTDVINYSQDRRSKTELSSVSTSSEQVASSSNPVIMQHSTTQSAIQHNFDAKERDSDLKKPLPANFDGNSTASKPKGGVVDGGRQINSRSIAEREATDRYFSSVLRDSSSSRNVLKKPEDTGTSFSSGAKKNEKGVTGGLSRKVLGVKVSASTGDISKSKIDAIVSNNNEKRRLGEELDYGLEDALEVARQVAKEVEREVVDYREEFCSSSNEKDSGGVAHPGSPDSVTDQHSEQETDAVNVAEIEENLTGGALSPKEQSHSTSTENIENPEDCKREPNSSQETETTQQPAIKTEKSLCDFDLNEELDLNEMDQQTTPTHTPSGSAPITVVSASKATAPGLRMAPLHFEGELGWKGSAATSAFRPAANRKTPDADKSVSSVEGSSQSSKQRQGFSCIDLNVAEGDTGGVTDPVLSKHVPLSSDIHSGESSIEVNSRRAGKLKLDLNSIGDSEETPSDWKIDGGFVLHHKIGHSSPSPASSSSSKPSFMMSFDLNDNLPPFPDRYNDRRPDMGKALSLDMNSHGGAKVDDPVISIMGTRVEVNKKEPVPQTRSFLPTGQVPEFLIGGNFTKTGGGIGQHPVMAHTPSPSIFGYNAPTAGSSVSLSPAIYGSSSVNYAVDSRGAPMIMGSQVAAPPTYSRPPFLMNMNAPISGFNGVVNPRPNLDLNSGFTMVEPPENRGQGGLGFRQLLVPGQGMSMEEHIRSTTSQPMNSAMTGMKRNEPDGGFDLFPGGYKQKSPWH